MKPKFVTFTGIDRFCDPTALVQLADKYPVEYGVLLSPTNDDTKYLKREHFRLLKGIFSIRLSAHLCGRYARQVLETGDVDVTHLNLKWFDRVQVNASETAYSNRLAQKNLIAFKQVNAVDVVTQHRRGFPNEAPPTTLLYDCSGGRGIVADKFPQDPGYFVGFAGGFGPNNIVEQLAKIKCENYYIDMEGAIRTDNKFDVAKCRKVCEAIWDE